MGMVSESREEKGKEVLLTSPLCLEGEMNAAYKAPNIVQRVFSLLSNVRPGADLTRFQLPPLFNIPKSQLQCYGESVYSSNKDLLSICATGETAVDRMISVVAWSLSTTRPLMFGVVPYNPILGETHHVSRGSLNVLVEQVSHHPPVTALHATDESNFVEHLWCQHAVPKFLGTTVEVVVHGKRKLILAKRGETYVMDSPKLFIRLLPKPGVDWVGNVKIECQETKLSAQLSYKSNSLLGFGGGSRSVSGKIIDSSSSKTLYEIYGHWDRTVTLKSASDGKVKVIYDAKEAVYALATPILKNPEGVWETESTAVWAEVSKGILSKDWDKARLAKRELEDRQREILKERKRKGDNWVPKHFDLSYTPENGWECSPKQRIVPPAPIISPI